MLKKFPLSKCLFCVLVARVHDYVEKTVKLVLLHLFHRQLMLVQPPKRLFGTLGVYSMYFSEFLQRWVILTLRLIGWHATRFCVSSYMKRVDHELHSADKQVCSLWLHKKGCKSHALSYPR